MTTLDQNYVNFIFNNIYSTENYSQARINLFYDLYLGATKIIIIDYANIIDKFDKKYNSYNNFLNFILRKLEDSMIIHLICKKDDRGVNNIDDNLYFFKNNDETIYDNLMSYIANGKLHICFIKMNAGKSSFDDFIFWNYILSIYETLKILDQLSKLKIITGDTQGFDKCIFENNGLTYIDTLKSVEIAQYTNNELEFIPIGFFKNLYKAIIKPKTKNYKEIYNNALNIHNLIFFEINTENDKRHHEYKINQLSCGNKILYYTKIIQLYYFKYNNGGTTNVNDLNKIKQDEEQTNKRIEKYINMIKPSENLKKIYIPCEEEIQNIVNNYYNEIKYDVYYVLQINWLNSFYCINDVQMPCKIEKTIDDISRLIYAD